MRIMIGREYYDVPEKVFVIHMSDMCNMYDKYFFLPEDIESDERIRDSLRKLSKESAEIIRLKKDIESYVDLQFASKLTYDVEEYGKMADLSQQMLNAKYEEINKDIHPYEWSEPVIQDYRTVKYFLLDDRGASSLLKY